MDYEPQKPKPDDPNSLSARLRKRAAANPIAKSKNVLLELIEARDTLKELRAGGHSSETIQELLEAEKVHATAGTIRNYRAQIDRAIEALELEGNSAPTDDQIHKMVIRLAAAAFGGKPRERSALRTNSRGYAQTSHTRPIEITTRRIDAEEDDQIVSAPKNTGTFEIKSDRENL